MAAYMTQAYLQVVAPSSLAYTVETATFTKGTAIATNSPSYQGETVTSWSVSPSLPSGLSFNTSTGVITGNPTALATQAVYTVTAANAGGSTTKGLTFTVNDVAPSSLSYTYASQTYTKGSAITANSPSSSGGAVVSYSVSPALPSGLSLNTTTGVISGTPSVLATQGSYTVTASNTGGSTTATVSITVNDVAPSALAYTYGTATYTKGTAINANSPTSSGGSVVSYSVSPALPVGLALNTSTGVISGTPTALATAASYTVTATNSGGSTTASLSITVNDVAPSSLVYTDSSPVYTKWKDITANSPTSSGGAVVSYSITPALPIGIDFNTATGVISGNPVVLSELKNYTVTATNSGGFTTASLAITVNDIAPSGLGYQQQLPVYSKGLPITPNIPSAVGGLIVSYSVSPQLPEGLSLHPTTGYITGTPTALSTAASYTVTAVNSGGSTTTVLSIRVIDLAPSSLTYAYGSPIYTKGMAITTNTPSVSGGVVVSYSVSPALPAGLSFNTATGVISGTPTALASAANYTVTATNTGGSTTAVLLVTVNDVAPSSLSYAASPLVLTKGSAMVTANPSVSGGPVVTYSVAPSLPSGLSFDPSTGAISGTPSSLVGASNFTVTASNSGGSTTTNVSVTVNDVAPFGLSYASTPYGFTRNLPVSPKVPSISGGDVVSYSVSPALPAGLALNALTGVISGTPTAVAGAINYTVTATNSGGSISVTFTLAVPDTTPLITVPAAIYSGQKATLSLSRATLSSIPKVQNHPTFSEQSQWARVQAVYVNDAIPYGDTDRIVGVRFRGANSMTGRFKATADSGDEYVMKALYLRNAGGTSLKIERTDLENPTALDFTIS